MTAVPIERGSAMHRKTKSASSAERSSNRNGRPQESILSLTSERNALKRRVAELRRENRLLKESLGKVLFDDVKINKRAMLKEVRRGPSFAELIAKLDLD